MPDRADRWPENAQGHWYVDRQCIDCDLCRTTAPKNFQRSKAKFSYVAVQPRTPDEVAQCAQAKAECPVDAIGNDA